jgi:hypothetical protein
MKLVVVVSNKRWPNNAVELLAFLLLIWAVPHRWCLHFIVVVGFECSWDPESYAGGSIATGRVTHAGQVKG